MYTHTHTCTRNTSMNTSPFSTQSTRHVGNVPPPNSSRHQSPTRPIPRTSGPAPPTHRRPLPPAPALPAPRLPGFLALLPGVSPEQGREPGPLPTPRGTCRFGVESGEEAPVCLWPGPPTQPLSLQPRVPELAAGQPRHYSTFSEPRVDGALGRDPCFRALGGFFSGWGPSGDPATAFCPGAPASPAMCLDRAR